MSELSVMLQTHHALVDCTFPLKDLILATGTDPALAEGQRQVALVNAEGVRLSHVIYETAGSFLSVEWAETEPAYQGNRLGRLCLSVVAALHPNIQEIMVEYLSMSGVHLIRWAKDSVPTWKSSTWTECAHERAGDEVVAFLDVDRERQMLVELSDDTIKLMSEIIDQEPGLHRVNPESQRKAQMKSV